MMSKKLDQQMFAILFLIVISCPHIAFSEYPPEYITFNDCLHAYLGEGQYDVTHQIDELSGILTNPKVVSNKTKCFSEDDPNAVFAVRYDTADAVLRSLTLVFHIKKESHYWEVDKIIMELDPMNDKQNKTEEIVPIDFWAGDGFSYSCNSLELHNREKEPIENHAPRYTILIRRFQLQPFKSFDGYIFASSYDCSVWLSLPLIMGFLLIIFVVITVLIVIYLMVELGAQTKDLKFSKQGGMLMNQSQLEATKG